MTLEDKLLRPHLPFNKKKKRKKKKEKETRKRGGVEVGGGVEAETAWMA